MKFVLALLTKWDSNQLHEVASMVGVCTNAHLYVSIILIYMGLHIFPHMLEYVVLCPQITLNLHEVTLLILVFLHEVTNNDDNKSDLGRDFAHS